jgi:putative ABC transport system permease protein
VPIVRELAPTLLGLAVLALIATAVLAVYRVPHRWAPVLAIVRGAAQLAVISVILSGVITSALWVSLALLVMFGVAAATATHRVGWSAEHAGMMAAAMAIELSARYALAIGGIVIGNAMSIATLAGRRFTETVDDHWDEVEGWLALGATPRQSTLEQARTAVYSALIPSVDQTKTTGLVTLPGAFVGAIFGGVSPLEAGRFQVVVLAAIMCTGALTAVIVAAWLAPVRVRPARLR